MLMSQPNEESNQVETPPELTAEDEEILDSIWDQQAKPKDPQPE